MIYEFLWNGKTHKVKKDVIIQDFKEGGHKMIDIRLLIMTKKLKWVVLYLNNHECLWRHSIEANIKVKKLNVFLRSNYDICENLTNSTFYMEVLKSLNNLYNID